MTSDFIVELSKNKDFISLLQELSVIEESLDNFESLEREEITALIYKENMIANEILKILSKGVKL